jgi:hypothetical protein
VKYLAQPQLAQVVCFNQRTCTLKAVTCAWLGSESPASRCTLFLSAKDVVGDRICSSSSNQMRAKASTKGVTNCIT